MNRQHGGGGAVLAGLEEESQRLDAALHGNAGHAEHVSDFAFLQARGVVFKGEAIELLIHSEAAEPIGVCELAEGAELLRAQRALQVVGDFDKRHAAIIAAAQERLRRTVQFLRWSGADSAVILYSCIFAAGA